MEEIKKVTIYTDGGSLGNPGPGGYGVVLICQGKRKELSGGFRLTTNNRMELLAAIEGLKSLKTKCNVTLYSDSRYLVDAINLGWLVSWQAKGWKRAKNKQVLNVDLWKELVKCVEKHEVKFIWVQGHAGVKENERCDLLTQIAANSNHLKIDEHYENQNNKLF
jgi:ribonuclease HI